MTDARPDPDALLQRVQAEEARAQRGRLKIFFGASAGVGKTYAMLAAARAALAQGVPLVVGLVETHGRKDTEAMVGDLPRLALKAVPHRERTLQEFDLDAALTFGASHRPGALVLLDELAHSNAPGSRHPKRWQDVEELQGAGIDVWTTMNVQHLESLNDIVSGITGVRVWETVPDRVFDEADEVVVVDLPPEELLQRLQAGKVYIPQQAERASKNFFRKGNLLALRELALRRTADRVDDEMQAYRRQSAIASVWPNREALLACVGPGESAEKVVRSCARLAAQLDVPWHAVHVETPALVHAPEARRQRTLRVLKLAQELGAITAIPSAPQVAAALVRHAREHNLARLVMGRPQRRWPWQRTLADAVAQQAQDLDVLQVALPAGASAQPAREQASAEATAPWRWRGYVAALAVCAATALLATPLLAVFELSNIVMLFLLAVVGVALGFGRGPAVLAAFVGVGLFDFFFVPPRFSFAVSDVQYLVTFGVMLVVALVVGQLTAGLKAQAEVATQREHRVRSLYDMSRDLSAALLPEQVAEIGARFLRAEFGASSALLAADANDRLQTLPGATAEVDTGVAQWAFDRGEAAGRGTDTLPASRCLVLPLKAPMRCRGVLAVDPGSTRLFGPEQRRLLDTCASLLAISLERIHYIDVAQSSTLQIESERLRNSLLSAISHDLRTPLAALVGLADALALGQPPPAEPQRALAASIRQSALRMSALVNNLLDMARLESGAVQLNRQWQPLEEVVGTALAACAPSLAGRAVPVLLADDLPLLHLDAVLIERVLVNLLENAAKYTPAGTAIEIRARCQDDAVQLMVDDHGPGLPPGREEALFQKFERGSRESATPGVGLGLAICRAILQAHGGTIRGETRPEGGARFTLTLPVGDPPQDDGASAVGLTDNDPLR
ncbi:MAG: two-component system sensor histidine kinase KdpD [Burkholderiales bacterium]